MLKVEAIRKATGEIAPSGPWFFSKDQVEELIEFVRAWQGAYQLVVTVQDA